MQHSRESISQINCICSSHPVCCSLLSCGWRVCPSFFFSIIFKQSLMAENLGVNTVPLGHEALFWSEDSFIAVVQVLQVIHFFWDDNPNLSTCFSTQEWWGFLASVSAFHVSQSSKLWAKFVPGWPLRHPVGFHHSWVCFFEHSLYYFLWMPPDKT